MPIPQISRPSFKNFWELKTVTACWTWLGNYPSTARIVRGQFACVFPLPIMETDISFLTPGMASFMIGQAAGDCRNRDLSSVFPIPEASHPGKVPYE